MPSVELCTFYMLKCLTQPQMEQIADAVATKQEWRLVDAIQFANHEIVAPGEIGSAGRYQLDRVGKLRVDGTLIFSTSVPYDVMLNVGFHRDCPVEDVISLAQEYKGTILAEIKGIIDQADVECFTVVASGADFEAFRDRVQAGTVGLGATILHDSCDPLVVAADFPLNCMLIVGPTENRVSEVQSLIRNLYRARGGAQHMIGAFEAHVEADLLPLEQEIAHVYSGWDEVSDDERLVVLRDLRQRLFEAGQKHIALVRQFDSLIEYEKSYMPSLESDVSSLAAEGYPYLTIISAVERSYLAPVKLLKMHLQERFDGIAGYVSDALTLAYSDTNLDIGRSTRRLVLMQVLIAIIVFVIGLVEVLPLVAGFLASLLAGGPGAGPAG